MRVQASGHSVGLRNALGGLASEHIETEPKESSRFLLLVTVLFGGAALWLGLLIVRAPLPVLLDRFIPDDAFYYLVPAKNFALHGFSSFDGIHFTNGYQPLWFLVLAPLFWMVPTGGEAVVRISLILQLLLAVAAAVLVFRILARHFGGSNALIAGLIWLVLYHRILFNGLETAVQAFLFLLLFTIVLRCADTSGTSHDMLVLGTVAGLLFLARTDAVFLLAALVPVVFVARAASWRERAAHLLYFGLPVAFLAGGYVVLNMWTTGHPMPVSGAAKRFYSDMARSAAGNPPITKQLAWITESPQWRFMVLGLAGPWVLLIASLCLGTLRTSLAPIRTVWPFYLGTLGSFVFYSLVFYGPYTQTIWYYAPHAFLAAFSIAAVGRATDELLPRWGKTGFVPLLGVGACLGWLVWPNASATTLGPALSTGVWAMVSVGGIAFSTLSAPRVSSVAWRSVGACVAFVLSLLLYAQGLRADVAARPSNWNFNLYQGALWAEAHLPAGATIWSGSAGILGYFSGHRVVNTDGLANDYEFLEHTLKGGKLLDYYRQWDYAIDAFPLGKESALSAAFPDGCWVTLPASLDRPVFMDRLWQRRLQAFKMKRSHDPSLPCEAAS